MSLYCKTILVCLTSIIPPFATITIVNWIRYGFKEAITFWYYVFSD